jgi:phospholipid N-methyltransferase
MDIKYQQYYTKSNEIVSYMIDKLSPKSGSLILEPCAGDGVFIDALLQAARDIKIEAFELDSKEAIYLTNKYQSYNNITIKNADTLLYKSFINGDCKNRYDYIIANPPYGAWQDYDKRERLQNLYPELYVKETYSTFLFLCLSLLRQGGRLVFIIPDTYLNLHRHTYLRKILLKESLIEEIVLFPSRFFPGVNFGYSDLSIITLIKPNDMSLVLKNKVIIKNNFQSPADLIEGSDNIKINTVNQQDILKNPDCAFVFSNDDYLDTLLKYSSSKIGNVCTCVTGIYTGDDKHYIKVMSHDIRNSKSYPLVTDKEIYKERKIPDLRGIDSNACFIPIVKGGNTKYLKQDKWYIDWSNNAVSFYTTNKKSRFQNASYYFKTGIAVPMVSSYNITAAFMKNRLFDQSIVGVFPKDDSLVYYLLAFFNSSICTKLIRAINPSANNSANYIKKIPIIFPDLQTIFHINKLVETILDLKKRSKEADSIEDELDNIFTSIFYENPMDNVSKTKECELFAL